MPDGARRGAVSGGIDSREIALLVTTTDGLEGQRIREYLGVVSGEAILGANMVRDFFAHIRDVVGGRSAGYEKELRRAKAVAMDEMIKRARERRATAIVGIDPDYEALGQSMLMVVANGTAVQQRR